MKQFLLFLIELTFLSGAVDHSLWAQEEVRWPANVELREKQVTPEMGKCGLCHTKKSKPFVPKKNKPELEHKNIRVLHGRKEMFCNQCHDVNNRNYLNNTAEFPASFANPSGVCGRCHQDKYKDWTVGIHGKRIGGWNLQKFQYQCTDCHGPHDVSIPDMQAVPRPRHTRGS